MLQPHGHISPFPDLNGASRFIRPAAGLSCASQCSAIRQVTGVGGTNVYGVVFKVIAKHRLLIMWNLRFAIDGLSTR